MKNTVKIALFVALLLGTMACEKSNSYSKLLENEQKLIEQYIARNNINVLDKMPENGFFAENEYYHFPDGIYIQLIDSGSGEVATNGRTIIVRFMQTTLDEYPVVESYMTTLDTRNPIEVVYGQSQNNCEGWQQAFSVMKRTGAHAKFIVPSKKGFDESAQAVTPVLYDMHIKLKPR